MRLKHFPSPVPMIKSSPLPPSALTDEQIVVVEPSKWGMRICKITHIHLWQDRCTRQEFIDFMDGVPIISFCITCRQWVPSGLNSKVGGQSPPHGKVGKAILWLRDVLDSFQDK